VQAILAEWFGAGVLAERRTEDCADHYEARLQRLEVTVEWLEAIFSSLGAVAAKREVRLQRHGGVLKEREVVSSTAAGH
jgi:hypothetical protein